MTMAMIMAAILPLAEMQTVRSVANQYGLDRERTALLTAIRKFENGRPGKEFGVERPEAMRYCDGVRSFRLQAQWAAGTIRRRYTGNLTAFAHRYCPLNAVTWERGVRRLMHRALNEIYNSKQTKKKENAK